MKIKIQHYRDRKPNGQFAKDALKGNIKKRSTFSNVIILVFVAELMYLGCVYADKVRASESEVINTVVTIENKVPILSRIADCESGERLQNGRAKKGTATHYAKNGQVKLNPNTNGSVDVGHYQINDDVWGKKATEMGLNIMVEKDNKAMAKWIYENRGTEDWYSSKKCWK